MKRTVLTTALLAGLVAMAPAAGIAGANVSFQIDAYLPAPPGVRIQVDAGRPYYVVEQRRVYLEEKPKHDNGRHRGHYKKEKHKGGKHGKGKHD